MSEVKNNLSVARDFVFVDLYKTVEKNQMNEKLKHFKRFITEYVGMESTRKKEEKAKKEKKEEKKEKEEKEKKEMRLVS